MTLTDAISGRPKGLSISLKITMLSVAATVAALSLNVGLFEWQDLSADQTELAARQIAFAQGIAASAGRSDTERAQAIFDHDVDAVAALYVAADGARLRLTRPGAPAIALAPAWRSEPWTKSRDGRLDVHVATVAAGRPGGELVLAVSERRVWGSLERNLAAGSLLALLSAALSGVAAYAMVRRALRPLQDLNVAMTQVSQTKDFSMVVRPRSADELGRLTTNFNDLLGELGQNNNHLKATLEELTEARDAADEANVMKSQFLANMSHEIRMLLNGILGMAQVMAMNPLTEPQAERLEVIEKSGASLLSVLNDLLDLSKIEAGRLELEQAPFDIEEVAQGAYATFTGVANIGGVSFAMTIAPEAKGRWLGDSVRVRQVLYNLISNALKFTSEGEVKVVVEATSDGGVKGLLIRVSDTGIGIAPDVLPRLFEKFVQADNSTTRRFGGTGLGLTICRHIVELMGGTIAVESEPGVGTTFSVALPLPWVSPPITLMSPPAATDLVAESDCGLEDMRILAAEDNATNQLVLKTVLHSMGLSPLIVENGRDAVEAWASGRFDLVLMDIQMPVMDGIAATREIRRRETETGCGHTRIVALSANAMKHQVSEYLAAGMDGHLAKPLQIEKLYEVLLGVGGEAQTDLAA